MVGYAADYANLTRCLVSYAGSCGNYDLALCHLLRGVRPDSDDDLITSPGPETHSYSA